MWFASVFSLVAMFGQWIGGIASARFGRKVGAMLVCPLYTAGHLCFWQGSSTTVLFLGRVIHGLACGIQHTSISSYIRKVKN